MSDVTPEQAMDRYYALFGPTPAHLQGFVGPSHGRCMTHQLAMTIAGLVEHWQSFPESFRKEVSEKLVVREVDGKIRITLL